MLLYKPLRELTPDDLSAYAFSAFLTVGDVADYLYFLPRILEISITEDSWLPDIEVTAESIKRAEFSSWSRLRRLALLAFLHRAIERIIAGGKHWRIDDWLCAIALMEFDVQPFLKQVAKSRAAVLEYFETNAECLRRETLSNPYWELPCPGHDAIVQWFKSEPIRKIPFEEYGYLM